MVFDKTWCFGVLWTNMTNTYSAKARLSQNILHQICLLVLRAVSYWKYSIMESETYGAIGCKCIQSICKMMNSYLSASHLSIPLQLTLGGVAGEDSVKWGFYLIYFALILHFWGSSCSQNIKNKSLKEKKKN